jgi:septum formation protein
LGELILASSSPRRADLLRQIGIRFRVVKSDFAEPKIIDENQVEEVALAKARSVRSRYPDQLILGADTIVVCSGKVLGKPKDKEEARAMLRLLSGRVHKVVTGIAFVKGSRELTSREETLVWMRKIEEEEISEYAASDEPYDKAAYAIQGKGAIFVQKIEGCFFNVVGLPLFKVSNILKGCNFPV